MAALFLMCGLPGSGKTTLAKRIERERGTLRLTPDEWIVRLCGAAITPPTLERCRDPVEAMQWEVAERALGHGVNVIRERTLGPCRGFVIGCRTHTGVMYRPTS